MSPKRFLPSVTEEAAQTAKQSAHMDMARMREVRITCSMDPFFTED